MKLELTPRQTELLQLMADGHIYKTAGVRLGIAEQTIKNHLYIIRKVLGTQTTTQSVAMAIRRGLIK